MGITERYWDVFFEKIDEAYGKFGTPRELREEVNALLKGFKPQVVGSPSFRKIVRGPDGQGFTAGMESYGVKVAGQSAAVIEATQESTISRAVRRKIFPADGEMQNVWLR
jgi:hypothetical protein